MIKSEEIKLSDKCHGEMRNTHRMLIGNHQRKDSFKDHDGDWRLKLGVFYLDEIGYNIKEKILYFNVIPMYMCCSDKEDIWDCWTMGLVYIVCDRTELI